MMGREANSRPDVISANFWHGFDRCHVSDARRGTQVLLLCVRRDYDRSIAGLGFGKAQRYWLLTLIGFLIAFDASA
jgi:hypothetical protein